MIDLKEASVKAPLFFGVIEPVQSVRSRACVGTVTFCGILFSKKCKRQIKDGYFLDRLLGIIPLFKEAFSWNQSSLQSISVSISPK
ncbi:hypothetical protein, partial [uncultured Allobaculum sp.]|uniref:hypothetical protein n=1 Tax=uncultured Allobaculum sp. TaxID=1187017 RepID=UPI0025936A9E